VSCSKLRNAVDCRQQPNRRFVLIVVWLYKAVVEDYISQHVINVVRHMQICIWLLLRIFSLNKLWFNCLAWHDGSLRLQRLLHFLICFLLVFTYQKRLLQVVIWLLH
jgi:hypothetical protein